MHSSLRVPSKGGSLLSPERKRAADSQVALISILKKPKKLQYFSQSSQSQSLQSQSSQSQSSQSSDTQEEEIVELQTVHCDKQGRMPLYDALFKENIKAICGHLRTPNGPP